MRGEGDRARVPIALRRYLDLGKQENGDIPDIEANPSARGDHGNDAYF